MIRLGDMFTINALKLRQNLGSVLDRLKRTGEPILLERAGAPVGVIIPLAEYQKRFVDVEADAKRRELVQRIKEARIKLPKGKTSLALLRELRS